MYSEKCREKTFWISTNAKLADIYKSLDIIQEIKSHRVRYAGHIVVTSWSDS